ncbi:MAG: DUF2520 domain-containing protein [Flavobacteriales bacterium]|nr:DUF2520 domain-containing protein [Flavobacteriales bacterium]MDG1780666.1 DUF2520 domain-containing protein [Flavobacteriales bacterium]MDG2246677.1 DUF2520 domain-containing protein [Flavobacteriales bacterium]
MAPSIDLIGSGNVATQLALALKEQGVEVNCVYARNPERASMLGSVLHAPVDYISAIPANGPMMIMAISDDAIREVSQSISSSRLIAHTSGAVSMDALAQEERAVFYPLQTFSKLKKAEWSTLPILIEASTPAFASELEALGHALSSNVKRINSQQRKQLHIAAVMVNNFTNHLYHLSDELLRKNGMDLDLLKPLILETASKIETMTPFEAQTGPASRKDVHTINEHLSLLAQNQELQELYAQLTESILKHHE